MISPADTKVQDCISEPKAGGKIVYSQTYSVSKDETRLKLVSFKPNSYVTRVAVNNILVKNLTFSTK